MDLLIAFVLFIIVMAASFLLDISMIYPLAAGLFIFSFTACHHGFSLKQILRFAGESLKESFIVIRILLLIGCLTGMWRLSGTVAYFVSFGISVVPPKLFLLSAFLLSSVMSYAIGTSFGVTATAGVILISIARAGNVDPILAAGAILSGVYVGDRGSPAASSGNLVAVLTRTDMRRNVKEMLKCSIIPFLICGFLYWILSYRTEMENVNSDIIGLLHEEFILNWFCIIPAVLMILLPFCNVSILLSMLVSFLAAVLCAILVQGADFYSCLRSVFFGFILESDKLKDMLSGGGIVSMLEVCGILLVSCSYGSIFRNTNLLEPVNILFAKLSRKIGRFPVMLFLGFCVSGLFCNQTIGAIMQSNLSSKLYGDTEEEKMRKMLDMENSVIPVAGLVPWCIASSVPLSMMGADAKSLPLAFYLWLVPLWWLFRYRNYSFIHIH